MLRKLFLLIPLVVVGACNAYDPDLSDVPFSCNVADPVCPDGYEAVAISATRCECHAEGADPGDDPGEPDAGTPSASCETDEDNATPATATATAIGSGAVTHYASTDICSASDVDLYRVQLPAGKLTLEADIDFDSAQGMLALAITDINGAPLAAGVGQTNHLQATHTATAPGTFLVKVATGGGYSSYELILQAR